MRGKLTLVTSLSDQNRVWLDEMGIDYEEVIPIVVHPELVNKPIDLPVDVPIVISSRYSVDQIKRQAISLSNKRLYAIGTSTATLAALSGLQIQKTFNYLTEFASWLYSNGEHKLIHLSGDRSVPGIETVFKEYNVDYRRVVLYRKEICCPWLGSEPRTILFFSPSGVESVNEKNTMDDRHTYGAIGRTTQDALSQIGINVSFMPDEPNFNSFILSALHYLKGLHGHHKRYT